MLALWPGGLVATISCGPVAYWIRRWPSEPKIAGSSPTRVIQPSDSGGAATWRRQARLSVHCLNWGCAFDIHLLSDITMHCLDDADGADGAAGACALIYIYIYIRTNVHTCTTVHVHTHTGSYIDTCTYTCASETKSLPGRLELPTLRLTASRSNQLS